MAETKLNMQLLLRRDSVFTPTYVLAAGEPGFEISTNILKVGDGTKTWAELPIANKAEIDALIKVTDDKVVALTEAVGKLNDTYATDAEVEGVRSALDAAKLDKTTYNAYVEAHQNDYTNTQIDAKFDPYRTSADQDAIDATFALKTDVETEFTKYTTTAAQQAIDAEQDRRIGILEAKPFDTYATKTEVQNVATDLSEYETTNDARVKAIEDEIDGFNYADATETANALNDRYTKAEADAAFTTPAEVIAEVNKALSEVSNADTIESITTLVNYVNENAADLTGLITEVYGSAEMTGDSRLDTIEAKAAMSITADDISAWNAEKGVKAIVDANKATWDKAGTALQAADLADYAKTADVVTDEEFTAFEATNSKAISDAEAAAKSYTDTELSDFNTETVAPLAERVKAIEDAPYATEDQVNAKLDANGWESTEFVWEIDSGASNGHTSEISKNYIIIAGDDNDGIPAESTITPTAISVTVDDGAYGQTVTYTSASIDVYTHGLDDEGEPVSSSNSIAIPNASGTFALTSDVDNALQAAKDYADALPHENTTYEVAATANPLEFTVTPSEGEAQTVTLVAPVVDTGIMSVEAGEDIVVTPGENGKVTVAHETFTTGEYTKDPASSDKTGDVYMMTSVTVDNGHVTGASVKSLAAALEGMTFIFDGGTSAE